MSLIIKVIKLPKNCAECECNHDDYCDFAIGQKNQWLSDVASIESVSSTDVRENVHGEWITLQRAYSHDWYSCSACDHIYMDEVVKDFNFCPNCGTDMNG